ncbi:hypothetical protein ABZ719_04455 [Streptomyces sp. NPDC006743]|uniref:hypothetical protein n=1 Tax=Streptomyces sp. NPDC006743 TaxID=3154480 RepID=UPI003455B71D
MDHNGSSSPTPQSSGPATGAGHPTLDVDQARARAKAVSSSIYEMIGMRSAKVTEPGPNIAACDEDPDHLYKTAHPWSVYGVSEDELKAGFQRLREELPKHGWKIVQDGPEKSEARSPALTADSGKDRFSVHAVLMVSTPTNPHEKDPLLSVNIVSGCWRAPEGTDLNTQY